MTGAVGGTGGTSGSTGVGSWANCIGVRFP